MRRKIIFFTICTSILFLNFNYNILHFVSQNWFNVFQIDCESLVAGNLVRADKDGILYKAGLLGWNHPAKSICDTTNWTNGTPPFYRFTGWGYNVNGFTDKFQFQFDALYSKLNVSSYEIYYSNPGGQAFIYKLIQISTGLDGESIIDLSRMLNSLFSAFTIALFLLWCYRLFGLIPAVTTLTGILMSQWIILYSHNVFYVLGSYFLPFSIILNYIESSRQKGNRDYSRLFFLLFFLLFIKNFLGGFEFITVTTLMSIIPFVFYGVLERWSKKTFINIIFIAFIAVSLSLLFSLVILITQIAIDKGSLNEGINYIIWTLERRSFGINSLYNYEQVDFGKSILDVIKDYWHSTIISIGFNVFKMQIIFSQIISLLLFISAIMILSYKKLRIRDRVYFVPLLVTLWISLLSPISWLVIFKNHSQIHMHMNPIIWHMPFLLFGYLFIGFGLQKILNHLNSKLVIKN